MSDYKMDIKGCIGLSEYSNIHDYFGMIDKNDRFRITLEKSNDKDRLLRCSLNDCGCSDILFLF